MELQIREQCECVIQENPPGFCLLCAGTYYIERWIPLSEARKMLQNKMRKTSTKYEKKISRNTRNV